MSEPPHPNDAPMDALLASLQPGFMVGHGRFSLVRFIGRGGMGLVWLARDESLREQVALKFLPPEIRFDAVALDDLRRETARARKLTHPNIIRIHDLYQDEHEAFISMEYIDGPNLSELRLKQPQRVFPWKFLEPLARQLCEALDYAHQERLVHRDLKPANVMLDSRGRLKLADFGIAAQVSDSASRVSLLRHRQSGTVAYMSPQQMDGRLPQVTDDIYALGATLYELLTSRPPFCSGDIAHQVRTLPPQPMAERLAELNLVNEVPGAVAAMIMACLGKVPESRPQNARAVADWIGPQLEPASPPAGAPSWERAGVPVSEPAPPPAPALGGANLEIDAAMRETQDTPFSLAVPPAIPVRHEASAAADPGPRFESEATEQAGAEAAPAGRWIFVALTALVVVGLGVGVWWLWQRSEFNRSKAGQGAGSLAANAFLQTEHVLAGHIAPVYGVAFSPDQKFLVSGSADSTVRVYETERGGLAWSTNAGVGAINAVAVSSDGRFLVAGGGTGLSPLYELASGREVQRTETQGAKVYAVAFSPRQPLLASADAAGIIVLWDYVKKAAVNRWAAHPGPVRALAFSLDGQRLASGGQEQSVRLWSVANGSHLKTLTSHRGMVWSIAFSPDGSMFVSTSADRTGHFWATENYATKRVVRWGSNANLMYGVAFSPDSKFIATGAPRGVKVFKVETAARGTDRALSAPRTMRPVAFSPDGRAIAAGGDDGLVRLWPFRGAAMFGGSASPVMDEETAPATNDTRAAE